MAKLGVDVTVFAGDDAAGVAVPDEDDVAQVLVAQEVDHVGDVDVEVGVGAGQMGAFPEAGQADRAHVVAVSA